MLKPDAEFNSIIDVKVDFLKKNNIKGLILDVDNTLIEVEIRFVVLMIGLMKLLIQILKLLLFQMVKEKIRLIY